MLGPAASVPPHKRRPDVQYVRVPPEPRAGHAVPPSDGGGPVTRSSIMTHRMSQAPANAQLLLVVTDGTQCGAATGRLY